jgi:hypothetical protein
MEAERSQSVATGGKCRTRKPAKKSGETVAVRCDRLPPKRHGKEGVSISSPEERLGLRGPRKTSTLGGPGQGRRPPPPGPSNRYGARVVKTSEPICPFACGTRFAAKNGWNTFPALPRPW